MKKNMTAVLCAGMLALVKMPVSAAEVNSALLLEYLRGDGRLTVQQAIALDCNHDGRLDAGDLTLRLRTETENASSDTASIGTHTVTLSRIFFNERGTT